jgi:hypothetical protein
LEELTEAVTRGWSERDSRVAMLMQERAGVQIRVSDVPVRAVLDRDRNVPASLDTAAERGQGRLVPANAR